MRCDQRTSYQCTSRFGKSEGYTQNYSRQREGIWQAHCLRVHHGQPEQQKAEYGGSGEAQGPPKGEVAGDPERGQGGFDEWIAQRYFGAAGAASSAEKNPAKERYVVGSRNKGSASGTVGTRGHNRLMLRQPGDADVQEAAEGETEER